PGDVRGAAPGVSELEQEGHEEEAGGGGGLGPVEGVAPVDGLFVEELSVLVVHAVERGVCEEAVDLGDEEGLLGALRELGVLRSEAASRLPAARLAVGVSQAMENNSEL